MSKFFLILILILTTFTSAQTADASEVSHPSAQLLTPIETKRDYALDVRTKAVRNIFRKYNSPLVDQAQFYVKYADEYGVDWKLLPSISGLESSFGIHLMPGSYNAYGWGGGHIYFESWEDGIRIINKSLRERYIDRGATDVWSIGPIYAESPTWSVRVNFFMNVFDQEYKRLTVFSMLPNI